MIRFNFPLRPQLLLKTRKCEDSQRDAALWQFWQIDALAVCISFLLCVFVKCVKLIYMNVVNGVLAGCEYLYIFIERWNELSDKIVNCSTGQWVIWS